MCVADEGGGGGSGEAVERGWWGGGGGKIVHFTNMIMQHRSAVPLG